LNHNHIPFHSDILQSQQMTSEEDAGVKLPLHKATEDLSSQPAGQEGGGEGKDVGGAEGGGARDNATGLGFSTPERKRRALNLETPEANKSPPFPSPLPVSVVAGSTSSPGPMAAYENIRGTLHKYNPNALLTLRRQWNPRHFELHGPTLTYKEKASDTAYRGRINLAKCSITSPVHSSATSREKHPWTFSVSIKGSAVADAKNFFTLGCEEEAEAVKWVKTMRDNARRYEDLQLEKAARAERKVRRTAAKRLDLSRVSEISEPTTPLLPDEDDARVLTRLSAGVHESETASSKEVVAPEPLSTKFEESLPAESSSTSPLSTSVGRSAAFLLVAVTAWLWTVRGQQATSYLKKLWASRR
jgi:hypothetical protein